MRRTSWRSSTTLGNYRQRLEYEIASVLTIKLRCEDPLCYRRGGADCEDGGAGRRLRGAAEGAAEAGARRGRGHAVLPAVAGVVRARRHPAGDCVAADGDHLGELVGGGAASA